MFLSRGEPKRSFSTCFCMRSVTFTDSRSHGAQMAFTEAQHIRQMIKENKVTLTPHGVSTAFRQYVESLPLLGPLGASVDWSRMPAHDSVNWFEKSDDELVQWARTLRIGSFSHVVVWYSGTEPCLLADFEIGRAHV